MWYPSRRDSFTATSGRMRGKTIPIIENPAVVSLEEWVSQHPDTLVLLGDQSTLHARDDGEKE